MLDTSKKKNLDQEIHRLCDLFSQGFVQEVLDQTKEIIQEFPTSTALHIIKGDSHTKLKQFNNGIQSYKRAIELKPDFAASHFNLGVALQEIGNFEAAVESYENAIKISPSHLEARFNIGSIRHEMGDLDAAIDSYKQILEIDSNYSKAYNNMGNALKSKGEVEEAMHCINIAIKLKPDYSKAFLEKGIILKSFGRLEEALDAYNEAVKFDPDIFEAKCERLYVKQTMCDWRKLNELEFDLPNLGITTPWAQTFPCLIMEDHPERQSIRASKYCLENYNIESIPLDHKRKLRSDKMRIGYFSADFHDHPVSHQIAKVFALHDREKIEVYAYSLNKKSDEMTQKIIKSVNHFKDVTDKTDKGVALLARKDKIDIAIDLTGYTAGSRTNIFAFRTAPIQINFHGYPSTMGAKFMDYIVADPTVIPDRLRHYYQEKIIYLPHSYMPTDNTLEISDTIMTRKDMGLPEDGFVFCCFSSSNKITPREFDIWMRLLHKVEGSVLWLRQTNHWAKKNLQKEAKLRGVDPSRLIFTKRLPTDEHLARHRLADLFLDTFNYNAHSTACDALWAGLPIVTKKGEQFVARCASSFLNTIGLPEMITKTEKEYEELALKLARNKDFLDSIKIKLKNNIESSPLFDTLAYTQNLEKGFEIAHFHYQTGCYQKDILV